MKSPQTKLKRGQKNPETGLIFIRLHKSGAEYWITKERFLEFQNRLSNYKRQYREKNVVKIREGLKSWYLRNKEKHLKTCRKYRINNIERFRNKKAEYARNYRIRFPEKVKARYQRRKLSGQESKIRKTHREKRCKKNPLYKIYDQYRTRILGAVRWKSLRKNGPTIKMLGCSKEFFLKWIEAQFKDGMSWENFGRNGWHMDHKLPLSASKTSEELYMLCHYKNIQPMWEVDNIKKSNSYDAKDMEEYFNNFKVIPQN